MPSSLGISRASICSFLLPVVFGFSSFVASYPQAAVNPATVGFVPSETSTSTIVTNSALTLRLTSSTAPVDLKEYLATVLAWGQYVESRINNTEIGAAYDPSNPNHSQFCSVQATDGCVFIKLLPTENAVKDYTLETLRGILLTLYALTQGQDARSQPFESTLDVSDGSAFLVRGCIKGDLLGCEVKS